MHLLCLLVLCGPVRSASLGFCKVVSRTYQALPFANAYLWSWQGIYFVPAFKPACVGCFFIHSECVCHTVQLMEHLCKLCGDEMEVKGTSFACVYAYVHARRTAPGSGSSVRSGCRRWPLGVWCHAKQGVLCVRMCVTIVKVVRCVHAGYAHAHTTLFKGFTYIVYRHAYMQEYPRLPAFDGL